MPKNPYNLTPQTLKGALPDATGDVIFVDSATGSSNGDGSSLRPFSTIDAAVSKSGVSAGDAILVMPGHAETIASAGACALDVAGVSVIGLGVGNNRPTLTFSATASTLTMSAANCALKNIITKPSIDSVVSPIVVSAAGCTVDIEHQDASATVEAVRAILTTAAADNLNIKLVYKGFTAGNAVVNAVRLVGGDNVNVDVNFFGVASTAVVEFHTTACSNVNIKGYFYNSGTTDLSKNVVDTAGSGTWFVDGYDGAAGASFSGGSGNAIAVGDLSAMASDITTIKNQQAGTAGIATFPSGVAAANDVSMAEVLRYAQENIIVGSGTAMPSNSSLYGVLAGATGVPTFPAAAAAANGVSIAEVVRYISENQAPRLVSKAYADLTGYDTAAAFTVTGDVKVRVYGVVGATAITSTSGTTTLAVGTTEITTACLAASTVDNTQFAATDVWVDSSPANDAETSTVVWTIIGGGADIILTRNVDDLTAGSLTLYCEYIPLSSDGAVVAA